MRARDIAALAAAVVFAGSTTSWALAGARPPVDLPPVPALPTSGSSSDSTPSSTHSPSSSPAAASSSPSTQPATTTPVPAPTSTWAPETSAAVVEQTPAWTPEWTPPVEPLEPVETAEPVVPQDPTPTADDPAGDEVSSDTGTSPSPTTGGDGATTGPVDESPGSDLLDPLSPAPDGEV